MNYDDMLCDERSEHRTCGRGGAFRKIRRERTLKFVGLTVIDRTEEAEDAMADTSNDSKLGRYLAVGVAAAGAACAATSLYWNLHFRGTSWLIGSFDLGPSLYGMSSAPSTPAAGKGGKKGKKKKKGGSSGHLNGMDTREPSTASTGPSAGGGPAVYETKRAVNEYLQFHFGDPNDVLPYRDGPHDALRFTQRCADLCAKHTKSVKTSRTEPAGLALDIGCAVGGATFELAKHFAIVEGLDYSRAFITAARLMKERGSLRYTCFREGEVTRKLTGAVNDRVDRARVSFREGDACVLPRSLLGGGGSGSDFDAFGRHDAVLAANLLCRLPDPAAFLAQCARLLRPGGVLVLVSPYSWLEAWTPKDRWLGGYYESASASEDGGSAEGSGSASPAPNAPYRRSFDAIEAALTSAEGGFDLVEQSDLPFLIKEHDRKFQWGVSHCTVWRRRRVPNA